MFTGLFLEEENSPEWNSTCFMEATKAFSQIFAATLREAGQNSAASSAASDAVRTTSMAASALSRCAGVRGPRMAASIRG